MPSSRIWEQVHQRKGLPQIQRIRPMLQRIRPMLQRMQRMLHQHRVVDTSHIADVNHMVNVLAILVVIVNE